MTKNGRKFQTGWPTGVSVSVIGALDFEFVSDFELRISSLALSHGEP